MKAYGVIICLSLIIIVSFNTSFASSPSDESAWHSRRTFIEENMASLGGQGAEKVDEWLALNGVHKVDIIRGFEPESSPGSVDLYSIDGYYDRLSQRYVVKGWWKWK
ncbi:MAG: hypothetical protein FH749_13855 [Firmicutes bacterium]|nr:hypothetical protein [Bacillota bacterium]